MLFVRILHKVRRRVVPVNYELVEFWLWLLFLDVCANSQLFNRPEVFVDFWVVENFDPGREVALRGQVQLLKSGAPSKDTVGELLKPRFDAFRFEDPLNEPQTVQLARHLVADTRHQRFPLLAALDPESSKVRELLYVIQHHAEERPCHLDTVRLQRASLFKERNYCPEVCVVLRPADDFFGNLQTLELVYL